VLRGRRQQTSPPSDVAGVYGAAGAGLRSAAGAARAIVLTNQKGRRLN